MFWKRKKTEGAREKKLSPKEVITNEIEQLAPGQALSYKHTETFGGGLTVVELNPQYPEKGKKYNVSTEKLVDNKPAGERRRLFDSNKPKDVASWILDRDGTLFS